MLSFKSLYIFEAVLLSSLVSVSVTNTSNIPLSNNSELNSSPSITVSSVKEEMYSDTFWFPIFTVLNPSLSSSREILAAVAGSNI